MTIIEEYINKQPEAVQPRLVQTYKLLKELLPEAEERISYGMPTFRSSETIIHFAAMKHHLGLYPTTGPIEKLATELQGYKTSKGAVQLPYNQPLPEALVRQIVAVRLAEIKNKQDLNE